MLFRKKFILHANRVLKFFNLASFSFGIVFVISVLPALLFNDLKCHASWGFTRDISEVQREREKVRKDWGSVKKESPGHPLIFRRNTLDVLVTWFDRKAEGDLSDVWFMKYQFTGNTLKFGENIDWDAADGYIFLRNTLRRRRRCGHLRQLVLYSHWNMGNLSITLPTATRTMMSDFVEDLGLYKRSKKAQKSVG